MPDYQTILPTDDWAPETGGRYLLEPGTYGAIAFATSISDCVVRARIARSVLVRPEPADLVGVGCSDNYPCEGITLDGLDVAEASVDGIRFIHSGNIRVLNCRVSDCQNQGIALHYNRGSVVAGCEIIHNGIGDSSTPRQAHGIYASGSGLIVRRNILESNEGWGVHLWDDTVGAVGCLVAENLIVNHPNGSAIVIERVSGVPGDPNIVYGNMIAGAGNGIQLRGGGGDVLVGNDIADCTYAVNLLYGWAAVYTYQNALNGLSNYDPDGYLQELAA